jgi:hypothetical protein
MERLHVKIHVLQSLAFVTKTARFSPISAVGLMLIEAHESISRINIFGITSREWTFTKSTNHWFFLTFGSHMIR